MNFKRQLKIPRTCFGSCAIHHQGVRELCLTEITRGGSQIFFVCLVGVWQRNFEPVVCVYGTTGWELRIVATRPSINASCKVHNTGCAA